MLPSPCHCQTVHGTNTDSSDRPQFILSLTSDAERILRSAEKIGVPDRATSQPAVPDWRNERCKQHIPCRSISA